MQEKKNRPPEIVFRADDTFNFQCHHGLACFTSCCRDITIFLSPYDVLRMRKRLGLSSGEFLAKYTERLISYDTGLPAVVLKMNEDEEKRCPFVTPQHGCKIYPDRPWSCRMYPVDIKVKDEWYCMATTPERCHGLREPRELTIAEWMTDQGLDVYEEVEAVFKEVTLGLIPGHKNLNEQIYEMFYMACYDLDRFRRFVFETSFLDTFDLPEELVEKIKTDDFELLQLGFKWLKFGLVDRNALKIKEEVAAKKKAMLAAQQVAARQEKSNKKV